MSRYRTVRDAMFPFLGSRSTAFGAHVSFRGVTFHGFWCTHAPIPICSKPLNYPSFCSFVIAPLAG
jgi:hypothetical protein